MVILFRIDRPERFYEDVSQLIEVLKIKQGFNFHDRLLYFK